MCLMVSFKYTVNLEECLRESPVFDESSSTSGTASPFTGSFFSSLFQFPFVDYNFFLLKKKKAPSLWHFLSFPSSKRPQLFGYSKLLLGRGG